MATASIDTSPLVVSGLSKIHRAIAASPIVGRTPELIGCFAALCGGTNACMHGPAGTAKSMLARYVGSVLPSGSTHVTQFTSSTTRDDVVGPVSLSELRADRLRYVVSSGAGRPDARLWVVEEFSRAHPRMYGCILGMMNERVVHDGSGAEIPAGISAIVGTTNSIVPDGLDRDIMHPLLDRWHAKIPVRPLPGSIALRVAARSRVSYATVERMTYEEYDAIVSHARSMPWGRSAWESYASLVLEARPDRMLALSDRMRASTLPAVLAGYSCLFGFRTISATALPWLEWSTLANPEDPVEAAHHGAVWADRSTGSVSPARIYHACVDLAESSMTMHASQRDGAVAALEQAAQSVRALGGTMHGILADSCMVEVSKVKDMNRNN